MEPSALEQEVLDLLYRTRCAMSVAALKRMMPQHQEARVRHLFNDMFQRGFLKRVRVMNNEDTSFCVYFHPETRIDYLPPEASQVEMTKEMAERLMARLEADLEQEPKPEPEVRVERRLVFSESWTALDVIDQWKLSYRLSRIIDIIWSSRKKGLTPADAAQIGLLARQHAATTITKEN